VKRKKPTELATDRECRNLYIKARSTGIDPLIFHTDGIPVTFFGNEPTPYVKIETVISWHEKEMASGSSVDSQILAALRKILNQFREGKVVFQD
jgi:hypothetical protein